MMFLWLAFAALLVGMITLAVYCVQLNSKLAEVQQQHSQSIKKLQHELKVINGAAMGVGQRLINAERKLKTGLSSQPSAIAGTEFERAGSLAEQGADKDQLIDQFGLSEAEAELMALVRAGMKEIDKQ